jgi:hypothetical protein
LPTYNQVTFASNSIKVFPTNGPTRVIVVFLFSGTSFAFDGGCQIKICLVVLLLTIGGINANCPLMTQVITFLQDNTRKKRISFKAISNSKRKYYTSLQLIIKPS